jgi:hypothetical protein
MRWNGDASLAKNEIHSLSLAFTFKH